MRILITNDDGIDSCGIRLLAETAKKIGEVYVVAPDGGRSAMSRSYTFTEPVRLTPYDFPVPGVTAYACDRSPVDAVRVGILKLMHEKPDLVLTGINRGYNISADIAYSATVGSALEASCLGVPAIAFSQNDEEQDEVTRAYIDRILAECIQKPLSKNRIWNVNFPACDLSACGGILWDCKVSYDPFYRDAYEEEEDADGTKTYRLVAGRNWNGSPGTDLFAACNRMISVGVVEGF